MAHHRIALARVARTGLRQLWFLLPNSTSGRNSFYLAGSSVAMGVGGMGYWFVAARLYSPTTIGVATASTSLVILLASLSQLGFGVGLVRFSSGLWGHGKRLPIAAFVVTALVSLVVAASFLWSAREVTPSIGTAFGGIHARWVFIATCCAWAVSSLFDNYLMGRQLMRLVFFKNTIMGLTRLLLLVFLHSGGVVELIEITGLGSLAGMLCVAPAAFRAEMIVQKAIPTAREFLAYSLWNHLSGLAGIIPPLVLPALVIAISTPVQAAAYYLDWSLLTVLQLIPAALSWSQLAERAVTPEQTVGSTYRAPSLRPMLVLAGLFLPTGLVCLALFGHSYFSAGALALAVLVVGVFPYYRALMLMVELRIAGSQRTLAFIYCGSQVAFLALCVPLVYVSGATGAAVAWSAGEYLLLGLLQSQSREQHLLAMPI
jgi:O-antigen/teichoic acid export membrane protein